MTKKVLVFGALAFLFCCVALSLVYIRERFVVLSGRISALEKDASTLNGSFGGRYLLSSVHPLVFIAGQDGFVTLGPKDFGFSEKVHDLLPESFIPRNSGKMEEENSVCVLVEGDDVSSQQPRVMKRIPFNKGFVTLDRKTWRMPPGGFMIDTNRGPLRFLVLPHDADEMTRLVYLWAFYSSISSYGVAIEGLSREEAYQLLFYDSHTVRGSCGDHASIFQVLLKTEFDDVRVVDFFGLLSSARFPKYISPEEGWRGVGHTVVEVRVDGRWIVVDPMMGLLFFDEQGDIPLSLAEVLRRLPEHRLTKVSMFKMPVYNMVGDEYCLRRTKTEEDAGGSDFFYMNEHHLEWNWSAAEFVSYWDDPGGLHMLPERYASMTDEEFLRYERFGPPALSERKCGGSLRGCVKPDLGLE